METSKTRGMEKITSSMRALIGRRYPQHRVSGATRLRASAKGRGPVLIQLESEHETLRVVVKPFPESRAGRAALKAESACLRECERVGLSAPALLDEDASRGLLMQSHIAGETLRSRLDRADVAECERLGELVGQALGTAHRELDPARLVGGALERCSTRDLAATARSNLCSLKLPSEADFLTVLCRLEPHLPEAERLAVCHGDPSATNVLLDDAGRPFLVDWADARIAAPESDVAFLTSEPMRLCASPEEVGHFVDAYERASGSIVRDFDLHRSLDYLTQAINAASNGESLERFLALSAAHAEKLS